MFGSFNIASLIAKSGLISSEKIICGSVSVIQYATLKAFTTESEPPTRHAITDILKDNYAPFDQGADTFLLNALSDAQREAAGRTFAIEFAKLLNKANFSVITPEDLEEALHETSLFNVRLEVRFDDFAEVVFYRRGEQQKTETVTALFGLLKKDVTFTNYDKVAVFIKFKPHGYFAAQKRKGLNFEPGSTIIKLFQNVPKADLEMLFPNSEIRMRRIDKAIIGGSAVVGGGVMLATKLGGTLLLLSALFAYWLGLSDQAVVIGQKELLALAAGFGVLGGFIFKEWSKFKNRKLKFMQTLSENLYFKNLDNNAGVFHHLLDAAEEEECKEALLALYFLYKNDGPMRAADLDARIEAWFVELFNITLDFEIDDALDKLTQMGLVEKQPDGYQVLELVAVQQRLDEIWDNIFTAPSLS